jgi:signal transduction histidine kinase
MDEAQKSEHQLLLDSTTEALRRCEERGVAGRLALEMIHEIKNPLEAISHLIYLIRAEADDPQKLQKYIRVAEEQMTTLRHVVSQTLGFARSSSLPRSTDFVSLVEAALRIHQRTIDSKKIHLVKDLPADLEAQLHMGEMLQVISNLVVNAIDALPENGTLAIRLRKRRGHVHLVIADNGHGIQTAHYARLFEPFFTTKADRGTGLGLALSKKIVERHNGKITVRTSVAPGRSGTAFRITIPHSELRPVKYSVSMSDAVAKGKMRPLTQPRRSRLMNP